MRSEFGGEIASVERHAHDSANGTSRRPRVPRAAPKRRDQPLSAADGGTPPPRQRWLCVLRLALLHRCRRRSSCETPLRPHLRAGTRRELAAALLFYVAEP